MNKYSLLLVVAQITLIWLVITPVGELMVPNSPAAIIGLALLSIGVIVFAWAAVSLRWKNLTAMPEPVSDGMLIERGPYNYIRHPMYTALIICGMGAVIGHGAVLKGIYLVLLLIVLWLKIKREERFLIMTYPRYANYKSRTHALLPKLL